MLKRWTWLTLVLSAATKATPKEMLPLVDKPLIQYVVNEAVKAGIKEIVLVTHASKNAIENHFPFFGWIHDLSAQDPYYILPLLMGASMFLIQKMSPTTVTDPMQQKIIELVFGFLASFITMWYSRHREFHADAGAAHLELASSSLA